MAEFFYPILSALSGTKSSINSERAVEEDKSKKKTIIKIKWEAWQPPDALNILLAETLVGVDLE